MLLTWHGGVADEQRNHLLLRHPELYLGVLDVDAYNPQDLPDSALLVVDQHGNGHQPAEAECVFVGFGPGLVMETPSEM